MSQSVLGWSTFLDSLKSAEEVLKVLIDPDAPYQQQQGVRLLAMSLSQGYLALMHQDLEHPDWIPFYNNVYLSGAPSPDFTYHRAFIDGGGVYRISGDRGTTRFINFTIATYTAGITEKMSGSVGSYEIDDLTINKDGAFEVILSAERPKGYDGNWWYLDPRAKHVQARQASYDWLNEVDGRLAIERLDLPPTGRGWRQEEIADRLRQLARFPEGYARFMLEHVKNLYDRGAINNFEFTTYSEVGGVAKQYYWEGLFEFAPDEALIVETDIPERAKYWSIQLCDLLLQGLDWQNCQSGLNGHQARLDSDGRFRGVMSITDPGVPNWLDTVGLCKGMMLGRWTDCSSQPMPTITKVKLAELRKHLPADTPRVSAAEREQALRLRRKGAQLRRRW